MLVVGEEDASGLLEVVLVTILVASVVGASDGIDEVESASITLFSQPNWLLNIGIVCSKHT